MVELNFKAKASVLAVRRWAAALPHSRWRGLPLLLAAAGILGSMACAVPIPILTLPARDDAAKTQYLPQAERGDVVAQYQLALCYRAGIAGVKPDAALSWQWLERAAQARNEYAQIDQADAWLFGDYGQAQNLPRGLAAWRALAQHGSVNAPFFFATRLADARNAFADRSEAARWFEAAARRGHRFAGYRLAQLLEAGARQPAVEAIDWVEVAAWYRWGLGSADAQRLAASLSPVQREQARDRWQALEKEIAP